MSCGPGPSGFGPSSGARDDDEHPPTDHMNLVADGADYDSVFSDVVGRTDELRAEKIRREKRFDLARKAGRKPAGKAHHSQFSEEVSRDEGRRQRYHLLSLNAYDRHKQLVNEYLLYFPGATKMLQRDASRDRRDIDVIRENHRFLWDESADGGSAAALTWGQALAKKYYEKLFKEYCICDVSRYKENKVAMRWRTEDEVVAGKGQFTCGARKCGERDALRTWEVNFGYVEDARKKNALVKVRLCPDCSYKLNYHHRKREVTKKSKKRKQKKQKKQKRHKKATTDDDDDDDEELKAKKRKLEEEREEKKLEEEAADVWSAPVEIEQDKTRDQDFSEFLDDLFL